MRGGARGVFALHTFAKPFERILGMEAHRGCYRETVLGEHPRTRGTKLGIQGFEEEDYSAFSAGSVGHDSECEFGRASQYYILAKQRLTKR